MGARLHFRFRSVLLKLSISLLFCLLLPFRICRQQSPSPSPSAPGSGFNSTNATTGSPPSPNANDNASHVTWNRSGGFLNSSWDWNPTPQTWDQALARHKRAFTKAIPWTAGLGTVLGLMVLGGYFRSTKLREIVTFLAALGASHFVSYIFVNKYFRSTSGS